MSKNLHPLSTILWAKGRMSRHWVASVRRQSRLKIAFIALSTLILNLGGFGLAWGLLRTFRNFSSELFGFTANIDFTDVLLNRMLSVLALTLLVLLAVSNVLVAFATFYRSREVSRLVQAPISTATFFLGRFVECVSFSSWGVAFLGAPLLLAYGLERGLSPLFYVAAVLFFVPFVTIPAALGATTAMVLVRMLAGRVLRPAWMLLLGGTAAVALLLRARAAAPDLSQAETFQAVFEAMSRSQSPFLPSHWFAQGLLHAAVGDLGDALFFGLLLLSWAALLVWVATLVAERTFYVGWTNLLAADEQREQSRSGLFSRVGEAVLRPLPEPERSLVLKDLRLFWRDPAQWSQFLLFFGLLAVYLVNMRSSGTFFGDQTFRPWIAILNMAASMLILATLTTRFVYPLISLEGRRFWILGLSPIPRRRLVLQKFRLSVASCSLITVSLALVSGWRLQLAPFELGLTLFGVISATATLSSLAVGLGAMYPNFTEDNPSRIISGMGGTLNFILSFLFIVTMTTGQAFVVQWRNAPQLSEAARTQGTTWVLVGMLLLTLITTVVPLHLGIRSLEETEF